MCSCAMSVLVPNGISTNPAFVLFALAECPVVCGCNDGDTYLSPRPLRFRSTLLKPAITMLTATSASLSCSDRCPPPPPPPPPARRADCWSVGPVTTHMTLVLPISR